MDVNGWNGPNMPVLASGRQLPNHLKTRRLREDHRGRNCVYLVVQPVLEDHLFTVKRPELISTRSLHIRDTNKQEFSLRSRTILEALRLKL